MDESIFKHDGILGGIFPGFMWDPHILGGIFPGFMWDPYRITQELSGDPNVIVLAS